MSGKPLLKLGTRGSPLALAQTREVIAALAKANPELAAPDATEIVVIRTTGDRIQNRTLADQGGKGLFIKEIEEALERGTIDAGVHSAKDVPTILPPHMTLACVIGRADPRDAFFARGDYTLDTLPAGSVVGTASPRRQAMVLDVRPDLQVTLLRGNVETRLKKLADGEVDATILAVAGLQRLGLETLIMSYLDPAAFTPAAGQGTIAIEIRADDSRTAALLAPAHDLSSGAILNAERAIVAAMDGSCNSPIGAWARIEGDRFVIDAMAAKLDGSVLVRKQAAGALNEDVVALGRGLGHELKASLPAGFFPEG